MSELSAEQIANILSSYQNKRIYEKERYNVIKDTEEFKMKNRAAAKSHYERNKEVKAKQYKDNREVRNAKSTYYYYRKLNKLDDFFNKKNDQYELLISIKFIRDFR